MTPQVVAAIAYRRTFGDDPPEHLTSALYVAGGSRTFICDDCAVVVPG